MERLLMVSTRRVRCLTSHLTNRVSGTRRCSQLSTVLASPSGLEISVSGRISTTSVALSRCSLMLLPHTPKQHRAVHATALVRRQQQQTQPRGRSALHTHRLLLVAVLRSLRSHVPSPLCPLTSCGCVALTADGRVPSSPCSLAPPPRPLPHCAPVTCARDSALRCSLRRRGSSMHAAPLAVIQSSTLDATLLHSAHAAPSHSSTHTGSPSPMLLAWIPLRSLPPPCGHCQVNAPPPPLPLSLGIPMHGIYCV